MEETILGLNADAIAALKTQHHHIFLVTVNDGEKDYMAICKEPTMEALQATAATGKSDELKGSMVLYDNCVLHADPMIAHRFSLKGQVIKAISEKTTQLKTTTKNL